MERYVELAKMITSAWARVLYVSAGEKEMPAWECMSTTEARHLHRGLRRAIRDYIPRQVMTDELWIDLKRNHPEFTQSSDSGFHFGCLQADVAEMKSRLAHQLGLDDLVRLVCTLDYQWTEVWGDKACLRIEPRVSPRALFGEQPVPSAKSIPIASSGGNPHRLARRPSTVGETPRWLVCQTAHGLVLVVALIQS